MEVVRGGVQNAIQQLSGTAVPGNMASFNEGADYVHPARTAAEIKADMAARRQAPSFAQVFEEEAVNQDDAFARLTRTIGPQLTEPEEQENATTEQRDVSSKVPWVF